MKDKDDKIKLLPCPFCGSKAEMVHMSIILRIRCTLCPAMMTYDGSDGAFEAMWNHRAESKGIGNTAPNNGSTPLKNIGGGTKLCDVCHKLPVECRCDKSNGVHA